MQTNSTTNPTPPHFTTIPPSPRLSLRSCAHIPAVDAGGQQHQQNPARSPLPFPTAHLSFPPPNLPPPCTGIAPDVHVRIFQPWMQADSSTSRRAGGTGIGLTISQRLVSAPHAPLLASPASLLFISVPCLVVHPSGPPAPPSPSPLPSLTLFSLSSFLLPSLPSPPLSSTLLYSLPLFSPLFFSHLSFSIPPFSPVFFPSFPLLPFTPLSSSPSPSPPWSPHMLFCALPLLVFSPTTSLFSPYSP
ncbi:unnamed protein product [Closterium sp. NIES-54]